MNTHDKGLLFLKFKQNVLKLSKLQLTKVKNFWLTIHRLVIDEKKKFAVSSWRHHKKLTSVIKPKIILKKKAKSLALHKKNGGICLKLFELWIEIALCNTSPWIQNITCNKNIHILSFLRKYTFPFCFRGYWNSKYYQTFWILKTTFFLPIYAVVFFSKIFIQVSV